MATASFKAKSHQLHKIASGGGSGQQSRKGPLTLMRNINYLIQKFHAEFQVPFERPKVPFMVHNLSSVKGLEVIVKQKILKEVKGLGSQTI